MLLPCLVVQVVVWFLLLCCACQSVKLIAAHKTKAFRHTPMGPEKDTCCLHKTDCVAAPIFLLWCLSYCRLPSFGGDRGPALCSGQVKVAKRYVSGEKSGRAWEHPDGETIQRTVLAIGTFLGEDS